MFCLPIEQTKKFVQALKDGVIDPAKLGDMASAERRTFFEKLVGAEDAQAVNALFESKLLLKNQQQGMINWAKQVTGIKEAVRRDIIAKIEKMEKILSPAEEKAFLQDLASTKLGTDISFEEAQKIAELSKQVTDAKVNLTEENRLDYGAKRVELENYVNELKLSNKESSVKETIGNLKKSPLQGSVQLASDIAGFAKGIKASLDNSAIFRQGWKTVFTNPTIWAKRAAESFANIAKQLGKKPSDDSVMNGIKADIYSRPNAVDGTYQKMKLDIGMGEEAFPTSLPQKIPLFGRLYKASQTAYEGFLYRMRADIADKYIKIAKENGVDLTDPLQLESIGRLTNSLTGRGNLGSFEKVGKQINTIFFSPKNVKASFDFLTLHAADKMSTFARKQAAVNLLKVVTGIAAILATAKALNPDSVELDPRSADFGKIKIGDTRFDVSGGMSSMVTLAARLIANSSKSSTTGKVTKFGEGYKPTTRVDVFQDYFLNKLSPAASVVKELAAGKDFDGNKPTILKEAKNLLAPLPITNAVEILNAPNGANPLLTIIADALGISTNTYSKKK
jgi:hypothetical protein